MRWLGTCWLGDYSIQVHLVQLVALRVQVKFRLVLGTQVNFRLLDPRGQVKFRMVLRKPKSILGWLF